jgi:hypothetical protein
MTKEEKFEKWIESSISVKSIDSMKSLQSKVSKTRNKLKDKYDYYSETKKELKRIKQRYDAMDDFVNKNNMQEDQTLKSLFEYLDGAMTKRRLELRKIMGTIKREIDILSSQQSMNKYILSRYHFLKTLQDRMKNYYKNEIMKALEVDIRIL